MARSLGPTLPIQSTDGCDTLNADGLKYQIKRRWLSLSYGGRHRAEVGWAGAFLWAERGGVKATTRSPIGLRCSGRPAEVWQHEVLRRLDVGAELVVRTAALRRDAVGVHGHDDVGLEAGRGIDPEGGAARIS